tara:strand:+ start:67 stop:282 length:216 start_codon:yes stop_codon:yes gene_type:complete
MKVTLQFEDSEEAQIYIDAEKYYLALVCFKMYLRNRLKYYFDGLTDEQYDTIESIQEEFINILNEKRVLIN